MTRTFTALEYRALRMSLSLVREAQSLVVTAANADVLRADKAKCLFGSISDTEAPAHAVWRRLQDAEGWLADSLGE